MLKVNENMINTNTNAMIGKHYFIFNVDLNTMEL